MMKLKAYKITEEKLWYWFMKHEIKALSRYHFDEIPSIRAEAMRLGKSDYDHLLDTIRTGNVFYKGIPVKLIQ